MGDDVPSPERQSSASSFGLTNFVGTARSALDDAAEGKISDTAAQAAEQEMQSFFDNAQQAVNAKADLMSVPEATQAECIADYTENADGRKLDELKEKFPTKNAMSYRQKDLIAAKIKMDSDKTFQMEQEDVFGMLQTQYDAIKEMPDTDDKIQQTAMFNTVVNLFDTCRYNDGMRNFLANLFANLKNYYDMKDLRSELDEEMQLLTKLYNEKEMQDAVKALAEKQAARAAALLLKGEASAVKKRDQAQAKAESAEAKASSKKAKK